MACLGRWGACGGFCIDRIDIDEPVRGTGSGICGVRFVARYTGSPMCKAEKLSSVDVGSKGALPCISFGYSAYWGGRSEGNDGTEWLLCCIRERASG
jgi:hypothetical protein